MNLPDKAGVLVEHPLNPVKKGIQAMETASTGTLFVHLVPLSCTSLAPKWASSKNGLTGIRLTR